MPSVSSSRATRIAMARESSPDSSNTRSSVKGGSVLSSSSAICWIREITVDLMAIHSSLFEFSGLRGKDELARQALRADRRRLEESLQPQEGLLEPAPRGGGQGVARREHDRQCQRGMPVEVKHLGHGDGNLAQQVAAVADRSGVNDDAGRQRGLEPPR